jgi:uncharacterized protein
LLITSQLLIMKSLIQKTDLDTGVILREMYQLNGRLHRDPSEGPAYVARLKSGKVARERYYWHGRLHREEGPARLEYSDTGQVGLEMYYRHGLLHRDPKAGPAWIERFQGVVTNESYFFNGAPFRDPADGPWHTGRHNTGEIERELYSDARETPSGRAGRKRRTATVKPPAP